MKLKKLEIVCLVVVCMLLTFTAGYFAGVGETERSQTTELTVFTDREPEPAAEPAKKQPVQKPNPESEGKVNLNTADLETLQELPGIGPVLAQRIIDYRESFGDFVMIEQLMEVTGVGEGKYEKVKDLITVDPE